MWLVGLVLGFILGFGLSESFGGALLLAIIGTFIGAAFSRSRAASKDSPYFNAPDSSAEEPSSDVQELRREIRHLQRRVSDIERHLGGETAKAPLERRRLRPRHRRRSPKHQNRWCHRLRKCRAPLPCHHRSLYRQNLLSLRGHRSRPVHPCRGRPDRRPSLRRSTSSFSAG